MRNAKKTAGLNPSEHTYLCGDEEWFDFHPVLDIVGFNGFGTGGNSDGNMRFIIPRWGIDTNGDGIIRNADGVNKEANFISEVLFYL